MPEINCARCSKLFVVPPCRIALGAKYCSVKCKGEDKRITSMLKGVCWQCGNGFIRKRTRSIASQFCTNGCYHQHRKENRESNACCDYCGKRFYMKPSEARGKRTHGTHCSNKCYGMAKSIINRGSKNPNYRGGPSQKGYRIYVPAGRRLEGLKRMKLHVAVCCEALGVLKLGSGLHVHHRDCDQRNNTPENLVVLSNSDHRWIHRQYGVATLWAHVHGKIDTEALVSWSDDKARARRLLDLNVTKQTAESLGIEEAFTLSA